MIIISPFQYLLQLFLFVPQIETMDTTDLGNKIFNRPHES